MVATLNGLPLQDSWCVWRCVSSHSNVALLLVPWRISLPCRWLVMLWHPWVSEWASFGPIREPACQSHVDLPCAHKTISHQANADASGGDHS